MATVQLSLPITLPAQRPLVPAEAAIVLCDQDERVILEWCEEGVFAWSWDIATPQAARREVRIWRSSLLAHLANGKQPTSVFPEVIEDILPKRERIRSTELERLFSCSHDHIAALIESGIFDQVEERTATRGPNSFRVVSRTSVVEFLRVRRIT
jgi:hypothetical protein